MRVIIPPTLTKTPEPHEIAVARLLCAHFKTDVTFLEPVNEYKRKTPDILMNGLMWEIKSPTGKSKRSTIEKSIKEGAKQSAYLIIDTRRTILKDEFVLKVIKNKIVEYTRLKKLLLINKQSEIISIRK